MIRVIEEVDSEVEKSHANDVAVFSGALDEAQRVSIEFRHDAENKIAFGPRCRQRSFAGRARGNVMCLIHLSNFGSIKTTSKGPNKSPDHYRESRLRQPTLTFPFFSFTGQEPVANQSPKKRRAEGTRLDKVFGVS